jgi:hypothetical protein
METDNFQGYSKEELDSFDQCLKHISDQPFWRMFIDTIKRRRLGFAEAIVTDLTMDQRKQDVIRGQCSELNFMIALDTKGRALATHKPKEK